MNNELMTFLYDVLEVCVVPLLGVLTTYFIKFVNAKSKEIQNKIKSDKGDKYVAMITDTITACVSATNQTYVKALKQQNAFTAEAQKEAFRLSYEAVMNILTDDAKEYLTEMYGDATMYITNKIESTVNNNNNK